jgi:hypothetical protein
MRMQAQVARIGIYNHVNSYDSLGMPLMVEGDVDALWVVYPDCILRDVHRGEIVPGSVITISPAKSVTIELAKPLQGELESCGYKPIFVSFERPGWALSSARVWWSDFQEQWVNHAGMIPESTMQTLAMLSNANEQATTFHRDLGTPVLDMCQQDALQAHIICGRHGRSQLALPLSVG